MFKYSQADPHNFRQEFHDHHDPHSSVNDQTLTGNNASNASSHIQHFPALIPPFTVLLKDGETTATIYPIPNHQSLPPGLLAFLVDEFNMEVERGDTFPFFDTLDMEEFKNYWFGSFAAVMVLGDEPQLDHQRSWEKECLGSFFIKANFPGRASHICTGGFLVNAGIRGKGIGRTLAEVFLDWAPKLGYTSSIFNLVFETNVGARRILESLNFKRIGKIKAAGILKEHENAVDAIIYGKELSKSSDSTNNRSDVSQINPHLDHNQGGYRFDKIKYYLEFGKYPPFIDRQEKSRLRSSASHYRLIDGKLTLNGREVISDPIRQLEICNEFHQINHGGINKTTSSITDKYHWTRIKDTVAQAIRNCNECRDPTKSIPSISKRQKLDNASTNPNEFVHDLSRTADTHIDFQNLDDPSGIFAAVEAAQRSTRNEQSYDAYDPGTTQTERVQGDEDDNNNSNNDDIPVDPEVSSYQYSHDTSSSNQQVQHNFGYDRSNGNQQLHQQQHGSMNQSNPRGNDNNNGVDVSGTNNGNGAAIEIARALIEANDGDGSISQHVGHLVNPHQTQHGNNGQGNGQEDSNVMF